MSQPDSRRLVSLDVLRAWAVLLVLGRHLPPLDGMHGGLWLDVIGAWWRGGWIGVDLFFVLSGFLVSGLLLREFEQHGRLRIGHFLLRRGLKIYPAFYLLIGLTVVVRTVHGNLDGNALVCELLFVQNYGPALWNHTWSLAVEEHFYLFLALLFLALTRGRSRPRDAFASLPWLALGIAVFCLTLRIVYGVLFDYSDRTHLYATVLRLDSLMFGVLLATWFHLHPERFQRFCGRYRRWLFGGGVALLVPPFIWQLEETPFIYTVGLTLLYLGSGMLLCSRLAPAASTPGYIRVAPFSSVYTRVAPFFTRVAPFFTRVAPFFTRVAPSFFTSFFTRVAPFFTRVAPFFASFFTRVAPFFTRVAPFFAPGRATTFLAWIGTYSYSIYLWHMPVHHAMRGFYRDGVSPLTLGLYPVAALATGIVMARLIEVPVLALRDRLLPSRSRPLAQAVESAPGRETIE